MSPDDPVCLCFHVSRRKIESFIRVEKPRRASQLSECFGAGTGCGWCRPYLERMLAAAQASSLGTSHELEREGVTENELSAEQYARQRSEYVRKGGGTPPPGATPINP